MKLGTNSTIVFLQTLHNDALGMGWISSPILPRKLWPKVKKKDKRAITETENARIIEAVEDDEWRLYLKLLWFTGASQTDGANLTSANLDWKNRVLSYGRKKLDGRRTSTTKVDDVFASGRNRACEPKKAPKHPLMPEKNRGRTKKSFANLWSRQRITKKAHAGRGLETIWESNQYE